MKRFFIIVGLLLAFGVAGLSAAEPSALKIQKIDTSRYPRVRLHLGLTTKEPAVAFKVWENGRRIKDLNVYSKVNKLPVVVTLLMDISGSMQGKPLEDAKAAAKIFIQRAEPADRIAVVSFSSTVNRVADFTDDKAQLNNAIDSLEAGGETAVYDALLDSLDAGQREKIEHQSVILLSDGADTASKVSGDSAAESAGSLKIPVSAIALQSSAFNPAPIENIARRSGGQLLTVASSEALLGLYDGLAAELHNRYQVVFTSLTKKAKAKVEIEAIAGGKNFKTAVTMPGRPRLNKVSGKPKNVAGPWVAAGLGFLAVFLLVVALGNLLLPSQNTLSKQLTYYDQLHGRKQADDKKSVVEQANQSLIEAIKQASIRYDFAAYAQAKLEQAGLPIKPYEYMAMHLTAVIAISLLAALFTSSIFMALLFIAAGVVVPLLLVEMMIERRKALFNDQLADTLDMLASSLRAGYGLQQAIVAAGREARPPTGPELTRVSNQVQMGMPLEDALDRMATRIGSPSFRWVVLAMAIHRETGGNLAEILDNLAASLRQRETMRRQIKALTAEGRLSAIILLALPFLEGFVLFYLNPGYMSMLVTTLPGVLMLTLALTLMGVGALWLRNITQIEY